MPEWSNGPHSKCGIPERVSKVRILPLPPCLKYIPGFPHYSGAERGTNPESIYDLVLGKSCTLRLRSAEADLRRTQSARKERDGGFRFAETNCFYVKIKKS